MCVKSDVKTAVAVPCLAAPVTCLLAVFQALLRGALSQQSAVILICMAIDRYMCTLHPARYHKHASKKVRLLTSRPSFPPLTMKCEPD